MCSTQIVMANDSGGVSFSLNMLSPVRAASAFQEAVDEVTEENLMLYQQELVETN